MEARKFDKRLVEFFRTADLGPVIDNNLVRTEHLNANLSFIDNGISCIRSMRRLWHLYFWYNGISIIPNLTPNKSVSMNENMRYQLRDLIKEYIMYDEHEYEDDITLSVKALERPDEILPIESMIFNPNAFRIFEIMDFTEWCSYTLNAPSDIELSSGLNDYKIISKAYSYIRHLT